MRFLFLFFFVSVIANAQPGSFTVEKYPVFPECGNLNASETEICFRRNLKAFISENIQLTDSLGVNNDGEIVLIFEVEKSGAFNLIYIEASNNEIKQEVERVFELLPVIKPATYNGNPTNMQFRWPLKLPAAPEDGFAEEKGERIKPIRPLESNEYDNIVENEYDDELFYSNINIPLSHEVYRRFDDEINTMGTNNHTAAKPLLYKNVNSYYSFENEKSKMQKEASTWLGRKWWNEHLISMKGEDYWFVADFGVDLQLGKDLESDHSYTYNNTRAAILQGGLGQDLNFYASVFESQGRFAGYFNDYAESLRPDGGNPAIIPGRGVAKEFMEDGYDYPVAEGYLSYSPNKFFNLQFGHGKNFIGDGYRSLFLSDIGSPYPYFKLNTTFWKFQYTNLWMSLRDVRPEVTADGSFRTKYVAMHYLSYNVTKRLNLGFFESVIWQNDNDRGFDLNYLNPVIFYRAIEFSTGSRGGNALLGLSAKYKLSNHINLYSQFLIDEFSTADIFGSSGSYKNKLGLQLGAKYFNAFNVENLYLQAEYNQVRPYTYSHNSVVLNYGHNNQSLAHSWGANFREVLGIAAYKYDRWYAEAKVVIGKRGFNFEGEDINYGGDIFASEDDRTGDQGHEMAQGNTATSFFGQAETGYIINPATNLKVFGSVLYRNFNPQERLLNSFSDATVWVNFGLRTDIFNWYFDY